MRYFPQSKRKLTSSTWSKVTKRSPSRLGETCFLYRKPQKLKILKIVFKKLFSKNLLKTFFFLGKSHGAKKNEKWPALWKNKLGVSFKMGYDESKFSFLRTSWRFYSALAYSWASNLCSCRTVRGGKYPAAQLASCVQKNPQTLSLRIFLIFPKPGLTKHLVQTMRPYMSALIEYLMTIVYVWKKFNP